jgi:hypothetical protein
MRSTYFQLVSFLLLTTSVILASCGGGGGGGAAAPAAPLAMKGTSGNAVSMNGAWTGCTFSAIDQENERDTLTFNGGSVTATLTIWSAASNANCTQTATPDITANISGTATLGAEATASWISSSGTASTSPAGISAAAKATQATLAFNSAVLTLGSAAYVTQFNGGNFCGFSDWAVGVPKNVLNCTAVISATTQTEYWVVDDSAAQLKWYTGSNPTAYQVENFDPMVK